MIDVVRWLLFLVDLHDRVGNVIHRHDVNFVRRAERKDGQAGKKREGADHVELRGLGAAAITQHNAGAEDGARDVRQKLPDHVLAEFLCARVGVVVRAAPVNGDVFGDHLVAARASDSHGRDVAEAAQPVGVLGLTRELDDFQSSAKVDVEAGFFGFAIERGGAVDQRFGRVGQRVIFVIGQAETAFGEIPTKNADARNQMRVKCGEIEVKLEALPKPPLRFGFLFRAHQKVQPLARAF